MVRYPTRRTMVAERAESLTADISAHIDCTNPMTVYLKASRNHCIVCSANSREVRDSSFTSLINIGGLDKP